MSSENESTSLEMVICNGRLMRAFFFFKVLLLLLPGQTKFILITEEA